MLIVDMLIVDMLIVDMLIVDMLTTRCNAVERRRRAALGCRARKCMYTEKLMARAA